MKSDKLFINLSNHPSELWNQDQLDASKPYGRIVDIPFPNVLPIYSIDDIKKLAETYVEKISAYDEEVFVHIMGEMTFTYQMVTMLKAKGIPCMASTTERKVSTTADGKKVSDFRFVSFRSYW